MTIKSNTFAEACYDTKTIAEAEKRDDKAASARDVTEVSSDSATRERFYLCRYGYHFVDEFLS